MPPLRHVILGIGVFLLLTSGAVLVYSLHTLSMAVESGSVACSYE